MCCSTGEDMPKLVVEISQELSQLIKLAKQTKTTLQYDEGDIKVEITRGGDINANLYDFYNIVEDDEQCPLEELVIPEPTVVARPMLVKLPEPPVVQEVKPPTIHINVAQSRSQQREEALLSILRIENKGLKMTDLADRLQEMGIDISTATVSRDINNLIGAGRLTCYNVPGRGRQYRVLEKLDIDDIAF
jgi:hypothetical protein